MAKKEQTVSYDAVIYTDGSCVLPAGATGGGAHGYLYEAGESKKNNDKPNGYTVTSHGYLEPEQLKNKVCDELGVTPDYGGLEPPYELKPTLYYNAVYAYGLGKTNNVGELRAVIDTINILTNEHKISSILICTDSMYVIRVHHGVVKNINTRTWVDEDRPNKELWTELADAIASNPDVTINLRKVTAHGTDIGNNTADRLAYAAREMSFKKIVENKYLFYTGKYWKDKPVPHPMLNFKQVFFNTGLAPVTSEHMYVVMDYPKDVELGKKSPEPIFGITVFKDPVVELDQLIDNYMTRCKSLRTLAAVDLRVLYSQHHYKMHQLLGEHLYNVRGNAVAVLEEANIVTPINPPGLAQNALRKTIDMYKYINMYTNNLESDGVTSITDVTDQLYETNDKGKLVFMHPQTIVGPKVKVVADDITLDITLVYGKDTLTRNQLNKLITMKPKVSIMVIKRGNKTYEYYCIIDTVDAIGVYGNYYINKYYI